MTTRITQYPYYCFKGDDTEKFLEGRYWNTNGKGICVVAVVTEGVDWAAYIGADSGYREQDCLLWASEYGQKLTEKDARHFFPDIKLPYRR